MPDLLKLSYLTQISSELESESRILSKKVIYLVRTPIFRKTNIF